MKKTSLTDNVAFEDKCLASIALGNIEDAYKLVCIYESEKEFSRGIGMDWTKEAEKGLDDVEAEAIKVFIADRGDKYGENTAVIMSVIVLVRFLGSSIFTSGTMRLFSRLMPELDKDEIQKINAAIQDDYFELIDHVKIKRARAMGFSEDQIKEMLG